MVIHNAQKSDAGDYVCKAVNMVGSKDSEPAKLAVQGKKSIILNEILKRLKLFSGL